MMPAPSQRDDWTLVQHGRRHHRPRDPSDIPPLVSLPFRPPHTMRRTYASFADPYGRDWVPRDPPPRDWEARSRPARDPSPFESASYPPAFLPQAYRSAFSPRRDERSYHEANACQNFRPDARDRGLPTGPPRPRHQVPSRPGPRPRARPRPPRHPRPPETSAARSRPLAPDAPRSDDPDFALKNRLIFAAIKAAHHLDNASGPDPLPIIARLTASLTASIRPAVPNAATLAFLDGNARDWGHTTTILLRDHYRATVAPRTPCVTAPCPPPTCRLPPRTPGPRTAMTARTALRPRTAAIPSSPLCSSPLPRPFSLFSPLSLQS